MADRIGKELWEKIEEPEGYAYLADDIRHMDDATVLAYAKIALRYTRRCESILRRFIAKHDAPVPTTGEPT